MRKIGLFLPLWIAIFATYTLQASPVDIQTAQRVAVNLLKINGVENADLTDISSTMPFREFYTFADNHGGGFVIVAADDCVVPILGYSTSSAFVTKNMPTHIHEWLEDYEAQIRFCKQMSNNDIGTNHRAQTDSIRRQWDDLLNCRSIEPRLLTSVAPLITTQWGQNSLYNNLCPYDTAYSLRTSVGCVATATAQIMKYWGHPAVGYGSHSYTHPTYGTISANFGTTTYAWSSMPDSLTSSSSSAQVSAVATLMHHIGVAVEMQYNVSDLGGSGSYSTNEGSNVSNFGTTLTPSAENALKYYFKYRSNLCHINFEDYGTNQWTAILLNELDHGRPIIYSGRDSLGGHSFVCDGYSSSGLFHFNWGWTGICDGYYAIGSLNLSLAGSSATNSYSFNSNNSAVIRIQPNIDFDSATLVTVTPNTNSVGFGSLSGGDTYSGTNTNLVTLTATAAAGCRFNGWTDGYKYNPRTFYANGGTYNFRANFSPLTGDTMGYCSNRCLGGYGSGGGGTTTWGIRIPADHLTAGHNLTKVMMYLRTAGSYSLKVYTGSTTSRILAHTQTFTVPSSLMKRWSVLTLSSPVTVTGSQPIWIVLESSVAYPAAVTYYAGNDDSRLWGSSLTTFPLNFSFMINAIFDGSGTTPIISNDTVSYCDTSSYLNSIGGGTIMGTDWGIKLSTDMVDHRNYVSHIMLFVPSEGTYTLHAYRGTSTTPSTKVATQAFTFDSNSVGNWQTLRLTTPIRTSNALPIWITFHHDDPSYPAAACAYMGDTNSSLISLDNGSTWLSLNTVSADSLNLSWMIKAVLSDTASTSVSIHGPTTVGAGMPATYTAYGPSWAGYSWSIPDATTPTASGPTVTATWNTPGSYNIIVTANNSGMLTYDTLNVTVEGCSVSTFPFTMGFETTERMHCWNNIDYDNDGFGWQYGGMYFGSSYAHNGRNFFASSSYIHNDRPLSPDNWLVSPPIQLSSENSYSLTWYDGAKDSTHASEHYSVYISTTGNSPNDFTSPAVFSTTLSTHSYTQRNVSLDPYAGQTVYISFRHHNSTENSWLLLDDITISESNPTDNYTVTVRSDNPSMGIVSGSGTYPSGSFVTITATALSGHHFVQWSDGNTDTTRIITVTSDTTFTAYFAQNETPIFTINVISANNSMGIANGGGIYPQDTAITITANALPGYQFDSWHDGITDNPRTVIVTADTTYIANFVSLQGIEEVVYSYQIFALPHYTIMLSNVKDKDITIFDMMGRPIFSRHNDMAQISIPMPSAGVYLVTVGAGTPQRIVLIQ